MYTLNEKDIIGLIHPAVDAHTLGLSSVQNLLSECGYKSIIADSIICKAVDMPQVTSNIEKLTRWIKANHITRLGFSYRLDPLDGVDRFNHLVYQLRSRKIIGDDKAMIKVIYFAGLPLACQLVEKEHGDFIITFNGDETPMETLIKLGVPTHIIPKEVNQNSAYDTSRMDFARGLIFNEKYHHIKPVDRSSYLEFGTDKDSIVKRVNHSINRELPPVMRAHVGPYNVKRSLAIQEFEHWTSDLAKSGLLDILSIGTSQLTQSKFGEDWENLPNGGGVPINSSDEFRTIANLAKPMLVRTYAGTNNLLELARMYEKSINIAWHALSLWWFCRIDGRGPLTLLENLKQQMKVIRYAARTNKPYEPNIPHHFAFRGADDVTYVASGILAARAAKKIGVKHLILQTMLNTPKSTWGIQDLAKARAMLFLARELEDERFHVILQPRAGLDYFSTDTEKAKIQLAAVSALMDDIEPNNSSSPQIIHVVSYSEANNLANPRIINESIKITRAAIDEYRKAKSNGNIASIYDNDEVKSRTQSLIQKAKYVLNAIERSVPNLYTPEGLYTVFASGFFPVPYLWEDRDEFANAVKWQTKLNKGEIICVDKNGNEIYLEDRIGDAMALAPLISLELHSSTQYFYNNIVTD